MYHIFGTFQEHLKNLTTCMRKNVKALPACLPLSQIWRPQMKVHYKYVTPRYKEYQILLYGSRSLIIVWQIRFLPLNIHSRSCRFTTSVVCACIADQVYGSTEVNKQNQNCMFEATRDRQVCAIHPRSYCSFLPSNFRCKLWRYGTDLTMHIQVCLSIHCYLGHI